jgi:phthalate 4,5-dioxygenase
MLSRADNDLLTQVRAGTPLGNLFRRFWLPAVKISELQPDGPPVRTRILGEDLLAVQFTDGSYALLGVNCPHRGASLFFGRNEEDGLRCVYHGWKFDVRGNCVDMPNEPPESNFKSKVRHTAYPARAFGGFVWVYMGPSDLRPELPELEWARVPDNQRNIGRWTHQANWLQVLEGDIDSSHSMFLHSAMDPKLQQRSRRFGVMRDRSPVLAVQNTDYGVVYGARYNTVDQNYNWRMTQWMMPSHTMIASKQFPVGGRVYVPVDDQHVNIFNYRYHPDRPFNEDELAFYKTPLGQPRHMAGKLTLADGTQIDTFPLTANRDNDYLIDRDMQRTGNYTGIAGIQEQDKAMTESMGAICNRTREHLGTSDVAIIAVRRRLLKLVRDLEAGIEPAAAARGTAYSIRSLDVVTEHRTLPEVLEAFQSNLLAAV